MENTKPKKGKTVPAKEKNLNGKSESTSKSTAPDPTAELTPEQLIQAEKERKLAAAATEGMLGPNPVIGFSRKSIVDALGSITNQVFKQPSLFFKHWGELSAEMLKIVRGDSEVNPDPKDMRFDDTAWKENWFYNRAVKSYLATRNQINAWIDDTELDKFDKERGRFIVSLLTEAFAPSNYVSNPAALKKAIETGGQSLFNGLKNFADDWMNNGGLPKQVNKTVFKVGKNLGNTKGSVVYRNEIIELIQYNPTTEKVFERPALVIPPQINKFYVFDLSPQKSLAQFMLGQGMQVFVISWRNPTEKHREWGLKDYLRAIEEAMDAMLGITGSPDCNVCGACSGGITLAALLGNFAQRGLKKINTATLLVSVLDAHSESEGGTPFRLFATDDAIETARRHSQRSGVLKGEEMAQVFSWMRPNDLIWNYWINNYLMGNQPPAFDILYWNADTTRLPAQLHSEFLDMYKFNPLVQDGEIKFAGIPINMNKVNLDFYYVAGISDHITPWDACYQSQKIFKGNVQFILSNSGHIQSILNPPGNPKASYFINDKRPKTSKEWIATAQRQEGSWWTHWSQWLVERSGKQKQAPQQTGNDSFKPLMDAPGTYVFE